MFVYIVLGVLILAVIGLVIAVKYLYDEVMHLNSEVAYQRIERGKLEDKLYKQGQMIKQIETYFGFTLKEYAFGTIALENSKCWISRDMLEGMAKNITNPPAKYSDELRQTEFENLRKQFHSLLDYLKLTVWYSPAKMQVGKAPKNAGNTINGGCCQ